MTRYVVRLHQEHIRTGFVIVEAESEGHARRTVPGALPEARWEHDSDVLDIQSVEECPDALGTPREEYLLHALREARELGRITFTSPEEARTQAAVAWSQMVHFITESLQNIPE